LRSQAGADLGCGGRKIPLSSGTPQQGFDPALGKLAAVVGCGAQHRQRFASGQVTAEGG
jgi:hypothetical protein